MGRREVRGARHKVTHLAFSVPPALISIILSGAERRFVGKISAPNLRGAGARRIQMILGREWYRARRGASCAVLVVAFVVFISSLQVAAAAMAGILSTVSAAAAVILDC